MSHVATASNYAGAAYDAVDTKGSHQLEHQKSLDEINMFIARNLSRLVTDPRAAINNLRSKLNYVGIDFKPDNQQEMVGNSQINFPVTRHGGAFGTTPEHDLRNGFYNDEGTFGKMSLKGSVNLESTGYKIDLKLVRSE